MRKDDTDAMAFTKYLRENNVLRAKVERERLEFEQERLRVEAED